MLDRRASEEQLASWGKVLLVETRGRRTGRRVRVAVGFVERPEGRLLVAAGSRSADWALNLLTDPRCTVSLRGASIACLARPLQGADHAEAVRESILKYGTPAERLGAGPAFELRPIEADGAR